MKFLYFIVLPFVGIFASLYGILEPLKATGTIGFKIKYFLKTEESTIFVRRTYAILLLITNILFVKLTNKKCEFVVLENPPVLGAILWALEIANNELPNKELKDKVLANIIKYQNSVQ